MSFQLSAISYQHVNWKLRKKVTARKEMKADG
jgi:hypothetical protein